ncbi:MAG: hypothetical protein PHC62_00995 [Candidatus Izemoplasmatales bacterium]|nr:hypothetical protein [Candidatus Izemoplasmatales bacterium]
MIHRSDFNRWEQIELFGSLSIPSEVHGYSIGVEFMKEWLINKFPKDHFKTVYINGKNVMDDFRRFNKEKILTIEKPALAIVPSINVDYDRDNLDLELGGRDVLVRASKSYKDAFFSDFDNNLFVGIQLKQLEMPFNFRIRVSTRAQQLDTANFLKMACRVGATQKHFLSMDFHIPMDLILAIAGKMKFEIREQKIVNIVEFLQYLNSHSLVPITYKYRTINGHSEFFIRLDNVYTHISNLDQLSLDDGTRSGHIDNNFHIEMNSILKIVVPSYYFFYSNTKYNTTYEQLSSSLEALYTYRSIEPPNKNNKGWDQYLSTEWAEDNGFISTIPFKELFEGGKLLDVIEYTKTLGVSPSIFLDFSLYAETKEMVDYQIDWDKMELVVNKQIMDEACKITIYIDKGYYNEQVTAMKNILSSRVE